jgi:hypothetical protein
MNTGELEEKMTASARATGPISAFFIVSLTRAMHVVGFPQTPEAAARFLQFVNASPTPFHAVHNAALRLEKVGFRKVCHHMLYRSHIFSLAIDQRER